MIFDQASSDALSVILSRSKDVATLLAALLAAAWFWARWAFGRRAIISVDCSFFRVDEADAVLAEIAVRLENVGDVKQALYGFDMSVACPDKSILTTPPASPCRRKSLDSP